MSLWSKLFGRNQKFTAEAPEQIRENIAAGTAVMLDVRSQTERDEGHLMHSIFISITEVQLLTPDSERHALLDKSKVIYCH